MSIVVRKPGLLTSIQAGPRRGVRHLGVPSSGAADPLSMALANRLVGNAWDTPVLEATLSGPVLEFGGDMSIGLAGAATPAALDGASVPLHKTIAVNAGQSLTVGAPEAGSRTYIAVAGRIRAQDVLGSTSTYIPGEFGGHEGRALMAGDILDIDDAMSVEAVETPDEFRLPMQRLWTVRVCASAETRLLDGTSRSALFNARWEISRRADRMGLQLDGPRLRIESDGRMPSAAVFPGTVQCTEGGVPFLLAADAGTTGGYPRIAQVVRGDRHVLGQLRPGDGLHLLEREPDVANAELMQKLDYWRRWLPDISEIL